MGFLGFERWVLWRWRWVVVDGGGVKGDDGGGWWLRRRLTVTAIVMPLLRFKSFKLL